MISQEEVNREVRRIADERVGGFVSVESLILFITRAPVSYPHLTIAVSGDHARWI